MPVTHRIDKSLRVVFSTLDGVVTADEIRDANRGLLEDPGFESSFEQLADHRGITELRLTSNDVQQLAATSPFGEGSRRAFVVGDSPDHFGMARQFEMWQSRIAEVTVFRSMVKARRWLGLEGPPAAGTS